jgi:uncharacterized protein (DUF2461 family)
MKKNLFCLVLLSSLSSIAHADNKANDPLYIQLPKDGAESFVKAFGSEFAKATLAQITKKVSANPLKKAAAKAKLQRDVLETQEVEMRLGLTQALFALSQKNMTEEGLSEKEKAQIEIIKLCLSALSPQ